MSLEREQARQVVEKWEWANRDSLTIPQHLRDELESDITTALVKAYIAGRRSGPSVCPKCGEDLHKKGEDHGSRT